MTMIKALAVGVLAALGAAGIGCGAEASTYNLTGTFDNGGILTGSIDFENGAVLSGTAVTSGGMFSNTYNSPKYFTYVYGSQYLINLQFRYGDYKLSLTQFVATLPQNEFNASWNMTEQLSSGFGPSPSRNGTATTSAASVVTPIPAALPLAASALAGLGGLGWLKRRRSATDLTAAA